MQVLITTPTLAAYDAICHDVLAQRLVLARNGIAVEVYSPTVERDFGFRTLDVRAAAEIAADRANVLLYHHSCFWKEGEDFLAKAACTRIVKYHNVTPPDYFLRYCPDFTNATRLGRDQTASLVNHRLADYILCDSQYNADEVLGLGMPSDLVGVLAPFTAKSGSEGEIKEDLAQELASSFLNLLFVGRVAPNKGHSHLIRVVAAYLKHYDRDLRLHLVGASDPRLATYRAELEDLAVDLGVFELVHFVGQVGAAELNTYYRNSQVFLLMSEHEGFCVPILEAQRHGLPVLALARGAVRQTLGHEQLVYDEPDYTLFACAARCLALRPDYRAYLAERGAANATRFSQDVLAAAFIAEIRARHAPSSSRFGPDAAR